MYSTVPPWLCKAAPLIDALTGVPGKPFPTHGSEVVMRCRGAEPSQQTGSSLGILQSIGSSSKPLTKENIPQKKRTVNPRKMRKMACCKGKRLQKWFTIIGKMGTFSQWLHNSSNYVNKCNNLHNISCFQAVCCGRFGRKVNIK